MTPPGNLLTSQPMEIEQKLALKAAGDPRSEWARLALEAAERIEALKRELEAARHLHPPTK